MGKPRTPADSITAPKFEDDCILARGIELGELPRAKEEKIVRVRPCASEKGKVMAEVNLQPEPGKPLLDPKILCELLEAYRSRFAEVKCSSKLGVGRFTWKARRVYLFKRGKIDMRFALDQSDASRTIDSVVRLILGSILCERCGRPAVECASGECGKCAHAGTMKPVRADDPVNRPLLAKALENLENALSEVKALKKGGPAPSAPETARFNREIDRALEFAMDFSLKTPKKKDVVLGVVLVAQALNVRRAHEEIISARRD